MWTSTRKRTHDRIPSSRYTLPGSIFITAIFDTININSTHTSCDEFPTWYMIDNGKKKSENAQRSIHSYTRYVYEYIWKDRKISTGSVQSPKLSYTIFVACTLLVLDKISPGIHRTGGCKIGRYTSRREWRHTEGERDYRVFRVSFFGSAECFRAKTKTHDQHAVRGPVLFAYESALPLVCKNPNTPTLTEITTAPAFDVQKRHLWQLEDGEGAAIWYICGDILLPSVYHSVPQYISTFYVSKLDKMVLIT